MTPTTLDLYMVSRLTPLATALEVVLVLGFFAAGASLIVWMISMAESFDPDTVSRNLRRLALTAIVPIVVGILACVLLAGVLDLVILGLTWLATPWLRHRRAA